MTGSAAEWEVLGAAMDEAVGRTVSLLDGRDVTAGEVPVAVLGAVMTSFLGWVCADPEHPAFFPGSGYHQHTGTPNPDTVYLTAAIDGSGSYRITGRRGTTPDVTIMAMGSPGPGGIATYPPLDLDDLRLGPDGRFDVVVSAERPPGHDGDWWQIEPDVRTLMVRSVSDDWGAHRDPSVAIVRLDRPSRRGRPPSNLLAARLSAVPLVVEGSLGFGIRKVTDLSARGVVNSVELADYSAGGGLPGQWYHEGLYRLEAEDALLLEVDLSAGAAGFSLALADDMGCTLDWVNAQTSLNRTQAHIDHDGMLRVVVATRDPGVANWLDTMGHANGLMQLRWIGRPTPPEVLVRQIAFEGVARLLPPDTSFVTTLDRDRILRDRALAAQQRILW